MQTKYPSISIVISTIAENLASFIKKYSLLVPKARMANSEDLHTGILFLASSKSNYVSGQNITIDGGLSSW